MVQRLEKEYAEQDRAQKAKSNFFEQNSQHSPHKDKSTSHDPKLEEEVKVEKPKKMKKISEAPKKSAAAVGKERKNKNKNKDKVQKPKYAQLMPAPYSEEECACCAKLVE